MTHRISLPKYSLAEELISAISHGVGALFAPVALILMLLARPLNALSIVAVCVYATSILLLYTNSTIYHALKPNKGKRVFRVLDHCAIYLLIAGTYTPMCVIIIGGTVGWVLMAVVWTAAVLGITLTAVHVERFKVFSMLSYLAMGWCIVFAMGTLIERFSTLELWLLIAGGLSYTVGAVLYGLGKRVRFMHSVWHLFVLAGTVLHFITIYHYLLQPVV